MTKNDPAASIRTLPRKTGPSKTDLQKARLGLDRVRLWMRGDRSVTLNDDDLIALESFAEWAEYGAILDTFAASLIARALVEGAYCVRATGGGGSTARAAVEAMESAVEVLDNG